MKEILKSLLLFYLTTSLLFILNTVGREIQKREAEETEVEDAKLGDHPKPHPVTPRPGPPGPRCFCGHLYDSNVWPRDFCGWWMQAVWNFTGCDDTHAKYHCSSPGAVARKTLTCGKGDYKANAYCHRSKNPRSVGCAPDPNFNFTSECEISIYKIPPSCTIAV